MSRQPPKHTLATAIVGIGNWGKNIARELASMSHLVAYASSGSVDNINWMSSEVPSARRMSIREICDDPVINAVVVATPIAFHFSVARLLLEAGKHTLVEKPLAQSSTEANELVRLASTRGLILATGYNFLFHPVLHNLRSRVQPTCIRKLSFEWFKFGTFSESIELNLLTHHIALSLAFLGPPLGGEIRRGPGIRSKCDSLEARLLYGSAEVISTIDRHSASNSHTITFHTISGSLFFWKDNCLYYAKDQLTQPTLVYHATELALGAELAAFADAASAPSKSALPTGGHFGAEVLRVHENLRIVK